jgi:protein tyrosine phosphatase (PTP) superfamily phosphohydrolase (DUF442 family)
MKNARRFDARIVIGGVPDAEDLEQLSQLRFGTLVDLRDEEEKFGGFVRTACNRLGLGYAPIPIRRDAITTANVLAFYDAVYLKEAGLVYCFSRFGKRPLAFLLLFEAIARGKPMAYVYKRAASFGFNLEGDLLLNSYLVHYFNNIGVRNRVSQLRRQLIDAPS